MFAIENTSGAEASECPGHRSATPRFLPDRRCLVACSSARPSSLPEVSFCGEGSLRGYAGDEQAAIASSRRRLSTDQIRSGDDPEALHKMLVHGAHISATGMLNRKPSPLQSLTGARDQRAEAQQVRASKRMPL